MNKIVRVVNPGSLNINPQVCNDDVRRNGASQQFWRIRERVYQAANPENLDLTEDDMVEIYLPPGRTILSTALMFLLPLAFFLAGYIPANSLVVQYAIDSRTDFTQDELAFIAGFALFLLSTTLIVMIRLRGTSQKSIPTITRRLTPSEISICRIKNAEDCGSCTLCD